MSGAFCSVCGAVLRDGVCPQGHPQRASRRRRRSGRRGRTIIVVLILVAIGAAGYLALVWYPAKAAQDLMGPSSAEFEVAYDAYRDAVTPFPTQPSDPQTLLDSAPGILDATETARNELTAASVALEGREPTDLPIISSRSPLDEARGVRNRMLAFYTSALEATASLERTVAFLTQLDPILPELDTLRATVGTPEEPKDITSAVAAATPITDQLIADLQALTPPDELGAFHASLVAIAERIRGDLDEVSRAGGPSVSPVVAALVQDLQDEIGTLRQTIGTAPGLARRSGLGAELKEANALGQQVIEGLTALRDQHGLDVSVPET